MYGTFGERGRVQHAEREAWNPQPTLAEGAGAACGLLRQARSQGCVSWNLSHAFAFLWTHFLLLITRLIVWSLFTSASMWEHVMIPSGCVSHSYGDQVAGLKAKSALTEVRRRESTLIVAELGEPCPRDISAPPCSCQAAIFPDGTCVHRLPGRVVPRGETTKNMVVSHPVPSCLGLSGTQRHFLRWGRFFFPSPHTHVHSRSHSQKMLTCVHPEIILFSGLCVLPSPGTGLLGSDGSCGVWASQARSTSLLGSSGTKVPWSLYWRSPRPP